MPDTMTDSITPALLDPLLAGTSFAGRLQCLASVPSTNTLAMQAAAQGAEAGTVFIADEQTAGRGRGGHDWHSPPGSGLYLSAVLRPKLSAEKTLLLSLAAGVAAQTAIEQVCHIHVDLRWPNDIMLGARKLGGILTESALESGTNGDSRVKHAVIGIGINVAQESFPAGFATQPTSLRIETGREWPRLELAAALLQSLHSEASALESDANAAADLLRRFSNSSSYVQNTRVQIEEEGGYTGLTCGLDERGFLQVRTESGVRTVLSGGVRKI